MPFGEELGAGVGPRTELLKYSYVSSDHIRKRFTGYEEDNETDLDFAEARMYQNKHGRFTAPDPLLASASAADPQTFNRYIYTGNKPVNITDPSGLKWCRNNTSGATQFTGEGVACEYGWSSIDEQQWNLQGDWSDLGGQHGEDAIFNPSGTISLSSTLRLRNRLTASQLPFKANRRRRKRWRPPVRARLRPGAVELAARQLRVGCCRFRASGVILHAAAGMCRGQIRWLRRLKTLRRCRH